MAHSATISRALATMLFVGAAHAGTWTTDATLGVSGDFSTNPALLLAANTAETHGALLLDTPTTYNADAVKFLFDPSFRLTNSPGYSSIASDYAHITAQAEIDSDLSTLKGTVGAMRDSSLYYNYSLNGSIGVRRDTALGDLSWSRQLTERASLSFDVTSSHVHYDRVAGVATLSDYRYSSGGPGFNWVADERTTLNVSGSAGLYDSLNGITQSVNSNLTAGLVRRLDELWTLSASAGYSRETNKVKEYFGPFLLGTVSTVQNGTVYSSSLVRQGTLVSVTASASRSLTPSGLAFLSRTDSYGFAATYTCTALWTFSSHAQRGRSQDPQLLGVPINRDYLEFDLGALRTLSEHWTLSLSASRVKEKYGAPAVDVAESGVTVQFTRKFNPTEWH